MNFETYLEGLRGKTAAVIGIGVSNRPLIELLLRRHVAVTARDRKSREALGALADELEAMGCRVYPYGAGKLYISCTRRLAAPPTIRTMPYPGFPTDIQAIVMALCANCDGTTVFVENIFDNRYRHVPELIRLGASIKVEGRVAVVQGVPGLSGAKVCAGELRGGAALVTAALAAEGTSEISGTGFIDRGYESIETALRSVGADISRR